MAQVTANLYDPTADIQHSAGFQLPVTAGNVFCTLTPPPGFYRVDIHRVAYGNGVPAVANNGRFTVGATDFTLSSGAVLGVPYHFVYYLELDGDTEIHSAAVGNGSANIGVSVSITATRLA